MSVDGGAPRAIATSLGQPGTLVVDARSVFSANEIHGHRYEQALLAAPRRGGRARVLVWDEFEIAALVDADADLVWGAFGRQFGIARTPK